MTSRPLDPETERVREYWARGAESYDRAMRFFDRFLFTGGREWLASRARGDVLEIGVGTGRNLPFYRPEARLTGVDISPEALDIARRRGAELGREVDLREGDVQHLEFDDAAFDTVVSGLTMCSVPDYRRAIREVHRVLRPGGRFLLLEHVRSPNALVRAGQRLLNPLAVRYQADHLLRDPLDHLPAAGFAIEGAVRLKAGIVERVEARKGST